LFYEHTRANLKIQEGCDFRCSYCIVPDTRGPARSRELENVLEEAKRLIARGHKEIVLTGVNISTYKSHGVELAGLVSRLLELGDSFRIRLGSTEPGPEMIPQLVSMMKSSDRLCRFLHLPIQYGEDTILQKMGRKHYDCQAFAEQALAAVKEIPELCLGTDIIVGFPGETDETFAKCKEFLATMPFGLMHIFPFSPRQGTPAATYNGRPRSSTVTCRSHELLALAEQKATDFATRQIGRTLPVLLEKLSPYPQGWSDNYLRVKLHDTAQCTQNSIVNVKITDVLPGRDLCGCLASN